MNQIPKIQYKNITVTGTSTDTDPIITGILDTSSILVGMLIASADFPEGTTVLSKTANTVTMSAPATASTASNREFYFELLFEYPPETDDGEEIKHLGTARKSESGVMQVMTKYLEIRLSLKFSFLSKEKKDELVNFYKTHASFGDEFLYFPDSDEVDTVTYEVEKRDIRPKKITPVLFEAAVVFRRVE